MKGKVFFFLLLFACALFAPLAAEASPKPEAQTLPVLSKEMHTQLDGLKRQSRRLTEQLLLQENELELSSRQVEALKTELNGLHTCLNATNRKLVGYYQKLSEYELKLKTRAKIIGAAATVLALALAVRLLLFMLHLKYGIKIPYIINLLL